MYVCVCHGVTDRDIKNAVAEGVNTMEGLGTKLKVGTCCGKCSDCAHDILCESVSQVVAFSFSGSIAA
jgi:bacterioferritin-associated ferredoxin